MYLRDNPVPLYLVHNIGSSAWVALQSPKKAPALLVTEQLRTSTL